MVEPFMNKPEFEGSNLATPWQQEKLAKKKTVWLKSGKQPILIFFQLKIIFHWWPF
jgi:hypothetical protein